MMNSFATIYFHNYLRLDEMPVSASSSIKFPDVKSPDKYKSDFDATNGGTEKLTITKDSFDITANQTKSELMHSLVTIKIDGKDHQGTFILVRFLYLVLLSTFCNKM